MKSKTNQNYLSNQVAQKILKEIRDGAFNNISRLPSEMEISEFMGVSRSVVRDALSILEIEGFVGRKRGVGTIVNRHVIDIKTRLDLEEEFLEMIRNGGYEPAVKEVKIRRVQTPIKVAKRLGIPENEFVYQVSRVITADNIPAIYCMDYVPERLVKSDFEYTELEKPIFCFLDERCKERISMDITEIHVINSDEEISQNLNIPNGTAVMLLKETGYNFHGMPVLYSDEYYKEGILNHKILRKNMGFNFNG